MFKRVKVFVALTVALVGFGLSATATPASASLCPKCVIEGIIQGTGM